MTLSIIINTASMLAAPVFIHSDVALQITAFFLFFFFFQDKITIQTNLDHKHPESLNNTWLHYIPYLQSSDESYQEQ